MMEIMHRHFTFCILLYSGITMALGNEMVSCPEGKFQPADGAPCTDCSRCPDNQIVRETCWQQRDTVCGAFTEFQPFYRGDDINILRSDNAARDNNAVTQHETDDNATGSWQTASTVMIVLLSVTCVLCVVLIVTVCYRCRMDKKDGLMIYVEKDSMDFQSPGCSDATSQQPENADDVIGTAPARSRPNDYVTEIATDDRHGKVHQFEIAEGSPTT